MNKCKNWVLTLAELAISAGTLVWIEDNNGGDEPCVHARMATNWESKQDGTASRDRCAACIEKWLNAEVNT